MIVNPGIRRFLGSAIQRLFNSASVSLPLTHTAIPTRGDITPSFTRATTETGQKWDEAGYLDFTALAGEIVFKGARRVRNLLMFTEAFNNAAWVKSNVTATDGQTDPNGGSTASRIVGTGVWSITQTYTLPSASWVFGLWVKSNTGLNQDFLLRTTAVSSGIKTATASWQFFSFGRTGAGGSWETGLLPSGGAAVDILVWHPSLNDITGETDQTTIRPYVSVGVESAPAYHGSMVDGVKCYDTDRLGNPISTSGSYPLVGYVPWEARTNLCLQSNALTTAPWGTTGTLGETQNLIGPSGAANSAWTMTDNNAVISESFYQNVTLTAAAWTASVFIQKTTGAQTGYPVILWYPGATEAQACTVDTSNGVVTDWTALTGFTLASGRSVRINSHNDDWWRVEMTKTGTAVAHTFQVFVAGTTNPTQSTGVVDVAAQAVHGFYGAQVELGSFATPYIPTTTVAVARNSDVEAVTTSGAILAAGGTISLTYIPYHSPVGTIALWGTYVGASNYTAILHDATNLIFRKRIAGVNYDATIANAFTSGTTYKMAASWGAGGSTIYLNGVAGTPHANTTAAQIAATMQVGADGNSLQQPGAGTTNLRIWQRQLSESEGKAITA